MTKELSTNWYRQPTGFYPLNNEAGSLTTTKRHLQQMGFYPLNNGAGSLTRRCLHNCAQLPKVSIPSMTGLGL